MILLLFRTVLTILAFFIGYHLKTITPSTQLKPCQPGGDKSSDSSSQSHSIHAPLDPIEEVLPADKLESLPKCLTQKVYDHCTARYSVDRTHMHLYNKHVPRQLFPALHHPESPAKTAYIITESEDWRVDEEGDPPEDPLKMNCEQVYVTRTGQRQSQPNKCISIVRVPEGLASMVQLGHRYGYTALKTDQYMEDYFRVHSYKEELQLLSPMLKLMDELKAEFLRLMGSPIVAEATATEPAKRRTATVMVANEGVMDLLLNFLCSAEGAGINLGNIMVFVGTEECVQLVESMGAHAMYSPALGSMPNEAAGGYLDNTFARMMWFKTTSVYLALATGFDVLFQDVDLVWLTDPVPYLHTLDADIAFMDDGARTPRYTPFFTNSGFYLVKYNPRTLRFQETMLKCGVGEIAQTHSHQSTLIHMLSEATHLLGLKVHLLDDEEFPSGQAYHENKPFLRKMMKHEVKPYVFHMCWTDNRENKVVYFKEVNLWYLPERDECKDPSKLRGTGLALSAGVNLRDHCCERTKYWDPFTSPKRG